MMLGGYKYGRLQGLRGLQLYHYVELQFVSLNLLNSTLLESYLKERIEFIKVVFSSPNVDYKKSENKKQLARNQ